MLNSNVENIKKEICFLGYHTESQIMNHIQLKLSGRAQWEIDKISQQVLKELKEERYLN